MIFTPKVLNIINPLFVILLIAAAAFGFDSRTIEWTGFTAVLAVCLFLLLRLFGRNTDKIMPLSLLGFVVIMLISVISSVYIHASLVALLPWLIAIIAFWATTLIAKHEKHHWIIAALLGLGYGVSLYGIYNFFVLQDVSLGIAATFGWRTIYGGFLLLIIPLSVSLLISAKKNVLALTLIFFSAITITNLALTFSQGAWLSGAGGLLVLLILRGKELFKKTAILRLLSTALLAVLLTSLLIYLHGQFSLSVQEQEIAKGASFAAASAENRLAYWQAALGISRDYPILGIGLGNYQSIMPSYINNIWTFASTPHNIALYLLSAIGFLGTLTFLIFLLMVFVKSLKSYWQIKQDSKDFALFCGLLASLAASFSHALIDVDWEIPAILLIVFIELGLLASQINLKPKLALPFAGKSAALKHILTLVVFGSVVYLATTLLFAKTYQLSAEQARDDADYNNSEFFFKKATAITPLNADLYVELSQMHWYKVLDHAGDREENKSKMVANAKKALTLNPKNSKRHFTLGQAYSYTTNEKDENAILAEEELKKALELNPYLNPEQYYELGFLYLRLERYQEAFNTSQQALQIYTDDAIKQIFADAPRRELIGREVRKIENVLTSAEKQISSQGQE